MACHGLYLHVPFCQRKCPYCDFYSVPAEDRAVSAYTNALLRALRVQPFEIGRLDTVYFGGGTPSVLGGGRIARVLNEIRGRFALSPDAEITVECNPHSALGEDLELMRAAGVNRISMGMQSVSDRQLKLLGRLHDAGDVESAVLAAQKAGFAHLSLDLMLATPGQTPEDIEQAVTFCDRLGVEHVSAYLLNVEPDTPFAREHIERQCPDEDGQAQAYLHAVRTLAEHGYAQYEISNFARDGRVARHNLGYWDCREYLGLGPSAHSFINGRRRFFPRDLAAFVENPEPFSLLVDDGPGGGPEEYLMLRLRLVQGVLWARLAARYPEYDPAPLRAKAARLPEALLVCDDQALRLTTDGFLVSNAVLAELLG